MLATPAPPPPGQETPHGRVVLTDPPPDRNNCTVQVAQTRWLSRTHVYTCLAKRVASREKLVAEQEC
jgi:hypothetical protein